MGYSVKLHALQTTANTPSGKMCVRRLWTIERNYARIQAIWTITGTRYANAENYAMNVTPFAVQIHVYIYIYIYIYILLVLLDP
jgi:hypothetical protein